MNVHFMRINRSPTKKAAVPLAFCLRAKKRSVLWGPMMMVRPMRKRIYMRNRLLVGCVFWCIEGSGREVSGDVGFRGARTFPMASLQRKKLVSALCLCKVNLGVQ